MLDSIYVLFLNFVFLLIIAVFPTRLNKTTLTTQKVSDLGPFLHLDSKLSQLDPVPGSVFKSDPDPFFQFAVFDPEYQIRNPYRNAGDLEN